VNSHDVSQRRNSEEGVAAKDALKRKSFSSVGDFCGNGLSKVMGFLGLLQRAADKPAS
jgi:hypothetical protein